MSIKKMYNYWWEKFGEETYDLEFGKFQIDWFLKRFNLIREDFLKLIDHKKVLELGCGAGSFMQNLLIAETIHGVELTEAGVKIARQKYGWCNRVNIFNLNMLNFDGRDYDIVIADQMLHHTLNTFESLKKAVSFVKQEGIIMFYVYLKKSPSREFMDDFLRFFTTKMGIKGCMAFSESLYWFGRFLTRVNLSLQRWIYWNVIKCFYNPMWSHRNCVRNIFDWYYVPVAHRHSPEEVKGWCRELNLKVESFDVIPSGISVRARK